MYTLTKSIPFLLERLESECRYNTLLGIISMPEYQEITIKVLINNSKFGSSKNRGIMFAHLLGKNTRTLQQFATETTRICRKTNILKKLDQPRCTICPQHL